MRVAKWPSVAFNESIEKARALAITQEYLNRLFEEGPDQFIQWYMNQWADLTKQILGFDLMEFMDRVTTKIVKGELQKEFPKKPPRIDERAVSRLLPRFQRLIDPILSVQRLRGQTLLEQAVVLGVTAYETYVADSAGAILRLNPKLADKFTPELKKGLGWERIKKHGKNLKEAVSALILEEHNALQPDKVRLLFSRLTDIERVFADKQQEKVIRKFIEHRHLIVHRSGKVDRMFRQLTGSKQGLDSTVELTTTYVTHGLDELASFAGSLQKKLDAKARGKVESTPPQ